MTLAQLAVILSSLSFATCSWLLGREQIRRQTVKAQETLKEALHIDTPELLKGGYTFQELAEMSASRITMLEAVTDEPRPDTL